MTRGWRGLVSLVVVALCLAAAARAQDLQKLANTTPQQRADIQTEFLTKRLGLSPEERTKIAALNLKYSEQAQPILTGSEGALRKMHALKEIESQKESELKGILTPAQFQKYLASKEQLRSHMMKALSHHAAAQ